MEVNWYVELLKQEVLPTYGCTEPGAVALAAAYTAEALGNDEISAIEVWVNANVYKNGASVGIPGTGETGLHIAAALGAIKKHSNKQLSVLSEITAQELAAARKLLLADAVAVHVDETKQCLWIRVKVLAGEGWCETIIAGKHTQLVSIQKNGEDIYRQELLGVANSADYRSLLSSSEIKIADVVKAVEEIPYKELEFLLKGIEMNLHAAEVGLSGHLGMGVGAAIQEMIEENILSKDMVSYAKMLTAAAADARMSGENVPVMSSAGSGNHGITVILPVYAVAKTIGVSQESLVRAVALSHLITVYIKIYTGNLSALCGCAVAAAIGASAAISWLLDGNVQHVEYAMKNMIANLTGMICDGGKVGCALKLATAGAAAVESALLAQKNIVVPDNNGILDQSIEKTVQNLGKISNPGMVKTDQVILQILLDKLKVC